MSRFQSFLKWILLSIYLYFTYHLLITPVILDLSYWGVLLVLPALFLLIWAIPPQHRRNVLVYAVLFLLIDKAIYNLGKAEWSGFIFTLGVVFIILFIAAIARWYGKLSSTALVALLLTGLITIAMMPRNEIALLNNFTKKWNSAPLYTGEMFDYFPIAVQDIDNDGRDEIITFGNREETEAAKSEDDSEEDDYQLPTDSLHLYVFKWNGESMERMDDNAYDEKTVMESLTRDHPGFPYYFRNEDKELQPIIQRQQLAEGMMQFGTSPYRAMSLNIENIAHQLEQSDGVLDSATHLNGSSSFQNIVIKNGAVSGIYKDKPFQLDTNATTIVDSITWSEGKEGFILLGNDLEIITAQQDGSLEVSHILERTKLGETARVELIVSDADRDGYDEILITSSHSRILKPVANGEWNILWTATDKNFRFEDVASLEGDPDKPELITLDQSEVVIHPERFHLRFLTGYSFDTEKGDLKRNWRSFISLINVNTGDVDGDNKKELIASIYQSHKVYVFERHFVPVTMILIISTVILAGYGVFRRARNVK